MPEPFIISEISLPMNKLTLLGALLLFLLAGCQHESPHESNHTTFTITSAIQTDTIINDEYVCQIRASQHIELRTLEKGYLQQILVDEGEHVKQGQLLFQIQPTIYQAELLKAQSEVAFAQVEYNNTKALADQQIVSPSEVALAEATLQKAQAELALAQTHLQFTEVRAPFDGIVGKFEDVRLGSLLDEGELLTTLSDNRKMWVYFNVPEAKYLDYAMAPKEPNEHVHLRLANNQLFPAEGMIETIESDFNNRTGNIAFRAAFPNPAGLLRHGQTGTILWPKEWHDVIMIPQKVTFEVLEKKFVFLVNEDGVVQPHEIKVAEELNHLYIVGEGLGVSDRFLLDGLRKVHNNDTIHAQYLEPAKAFADLHLHAE